MKSNRPHLSLTILYWVEILTGPPQVLPMDDPCRFQEGALACVADPAAGFSQPASIRSYFSQDNQVFISLPFCFWSALPPMTTQLSKYTYSTARWEVLMLYFLLQNTTIMSAWNVDPEHPVLSKRSGLGSLGILDKLLYLNL